MRYLSTFSGIGGFELGIQLAYEQISSRMGHQNGQDIRLQRRQETLNSTGADLSLPECNLSDVGHSSRSQNYPECIGYSEIDKYASAIYQSHFPYEQCSFCKEKEERERKAAKERVRVGGNKSYNERDEELGSSQPSSLKHNLNSPNRQLNCSCKHKPYGDITKIVAEKLPDFDLLVGGFPCQAFSIAGKRGGFEDTRGTMFFELARIAKAKVPMFLLLENVKGLVSHNGGQTLEVILETLQELGYYTNYEIHNSKDHGVPQNRERVFIIGHLRGTPRPEVFPFGHSNPKTPQQLLGGSQGNRVYSPKGTSVTLASQAGGQGAKTGLYAMRGRENGQQLEYRGNETNTLTSVQKDNLWYEGTTIRRLTPTECERLQGFPYCWTEGVSDTQRYKMLGNAVTVNVIKDLFTHIL